MTVMLECSGLTKRYGKQTALDHIDLTLESGRIIGLLGPNGSGKTTLMKLINGLLTPSEGEVKVLGQAPCAATKAEVSYLPDASYLSKWMSIQELVSMFADFYENFDTERAYRMLDELHLNRKAQLKTLSKGNKEKVQLILAMSRNAKVYCLDEPIGGVDPAARDYILQTIIRNYSKDAMVLISTHLIADVEPVLDEVVFVKDGHILLHEDAEEIREKHGMSVDKFFREEFKC